MRIFAAIAFLALVPPSAPRRSPFVERITTNDNRTSAGVLSNGVLTIQLEAREGEWFPDAESARGVIVRAFAERGKKLSAPGPMIRVPEGTTVNASVTNSLNELLIVRGLATHNESASPDSTIIAPGETREFHFAAGRAGTYYYHATTATRPDLNAVDAELSGAFIVDPAGTQHTNDRVFVISLWGVSVAPPLAAPPIARFAINGKAWPNTEHLSYTAGDTVRFRLINTSNVPHPMHLHGFYFDVTSRGDGGVDSVYSSAAPPYRAVTERLAAGRTFTLAWVPDRAGNWLFHCHDNFHVLRNDPLDGSKLPAEHRAHITNHATDMMGGLVMGIEVKSRSNVRSVVAPNASRRLRLIAKRDSGGSDKEPAYGYVLLEGTTATPMSGPLLPGPVIVLKRGEPVAITVVNHLTEATAVHWHGMELESYYDGVADFSGSDKHIAHAIAPGDSFVAHFTPPRSGTFMYHPHADEVRQQQAGLSGTLLVVDDLSTYDPKHDLNFLLTVPRNAADNSRILINGSMRPPPIDMKVGERYRFRVVNLHTSRPGMIVRLVRDSTVLTWRSLAKDGMDLPAQRAIMRGAVQQMGNGEAYDYEVIPTQAGDLRFTVTTGLQVPLGEVALRVRQ